MGRTKERRNPAEAYIGNKVRQARMLAGLSQSDVGLALTPPITFQQVQKYENGNNRVSAGRLAQIAQVTKQPLSFFYNGVPVPGVTINGDAAKHRAESTQIEAFMAKPDGLRLVRILAQVNDDKVLHAVLHVVDYWLEFLSDRRSK